LLSCLEPETGEREKEGEKGGGEETEENREEEAGEGPMDGEAGERGHETGSKGCQAEREKEKA
jgi:hypothetical protein